MQRKAVDKTFDEVNRLIDNARIALKKDAAKSLSILDKALNVLPAVDKGMKRAEILFEKANAFKKLNELHNSLHCLEEVIDLLGKKGMEESVARCKEELSDIYFRQGIHELALSKMFEVLEFWKQQNKRLETASMYNRIGELYKSQQEYTKAIEQHLLALKLYEELDSRRELSLTNFYIGNCYNWANELEPAKNYLATSLKIADEAGDPQLKIKPMGSMAILLTKEKDYVHALKYFHDCIDALNISGDDFLKADILKSLGKLYIELNQPDKAVEILEDALKLSQKLKLKFPTNLIHEFLSQAFEMRGEYEKAFNHFKSSAELNKEIRNEEIALKTAGVQVKYDLDKFRTEKEQAERNSKLKDRFLSGISHELRTSLNGIEGMVNLLSETHPSPEQLEYISTIRLSANNLLVIISDLLDYSRINEGNIDFEKQEFKIKEQLTSLIQMLKAKTDEKNLKLMMHYDPQLPDHLIGDPMRLNQILLNLLNNAIKFTEKGSVELEVEKIKDDPKEISLLFKITDTGVGIAEKQLPFIFEKFANPQHFPDDNKGTGIGLSLVKNLVERQGGKVYVKSKLNKGSVFCVEISYQIAEKKSRKAALTRKSNVSPVDLTNIRVLLVEDNKVNQFLARQLLSKMGFNVTVAGNADAAISILNKEKFNVILMDVQMPGMSGYDLSRYIRNHHDSISTLPIIAITAYASANEKELAMQAGMTDYVTKPYSPQELLAVIMKHLKVSEKSGTAATDDLIHNLRQLMGNSPADLIELVSVFIQQTPLMNDQLQESIRSRNWEGAYHAAHKLKSSLRILKGEKLSGIISQLEDNAAQLKNLESMERLYEEYMECCNGYLKVLQNALPGLKLQN